jgi:ribosomal protein S18 acetylase RimI-like enzyme
MTAREQTSLSVLLDISLRPARHDDLPKLEWHGQYAHQRGLFRRAYSEQLQGNRLMLLADCGGFPIGHLFIQFNGGEPGVADGTQRAYLYAFRVMEMFRGRGIGTALIAEAEGVVLGRGFQFTTIAVAKDNPAARRLYDRLGYRIFREDPGNWSYRDHQGQVRWVNEPCWLMQKELHLH